MMLAEKKPWYKEPWPWILMAGPGVVIGAGVITAWLAISSNDGLVADDYYKQGLSINQQMKRDKAAESSGVRAEIVRKGLDIRMQLRQSDNNSTLPPILNLKIMHPTRAGLDQSLTLITEGKGEYSGKLASELTGRWHVTLEEPAGNWRLTADWKADQTDTLLLVASK